MWRISDMWWILDFLLYNCAIQSTTVLQLHYVVVHPKVGEGLILKK